MSKYVIRSTNPATKLSAIVSGGPYDTKAEAERKCINLAMEERVGSSKRFAVTLVFTVEEFDHAG